MRGKGEMAEAYHEDLPARLTLGHHGVWPVAVPYTGMKLSIRGKKGARCLHGSYKPCGSRKAPAFLLRVWDFDTCWAEGAYMVIPECRMSYEVPWEATSCMCCHNLSLEKLNVSCVTPLREDSGKLTSDLPQPSPLALLPFADLRCVLWLEYVLVTSSAVC